MSNYTPKPEHKFTFGLWTVGNRGDDGWMSPVHKEFLVFPGLYRFAFKLKPLTSQDDPGSVARMKIEGEF